ncbi:MAG TPA: cytochrome c-type biogenesis protein CcmH [Devosia sp.]|nr:cytochrome c-type biogenesis protein CcmH [Devosia sp.]
MKWSLTVLQILMVVASLAVVSPAGAVNPDEILADPVLEARARDISAELRCLVCQNQSIDDSDAPLARDLRLLVRERLVAGDADSEVFDFVVARYGEFVLLKPYFGLHTLALWGATPVVLLIAIAALIITRRGQKARPGKASVPAVGLSAKEQEVLASLQDESSTPPKHEAES